MQDLSIYFEPIQSDISISEGSLGDKIIYYTDEFPELKSRSIAIIFCPEFRGDNPRYIAGYRDDFRKSLSKLHYRSSWNFNIYDLGTIKPGAGVNDTYYALTEVISTLIKKDVFPIVVGGSQDLTFSIYQAYFKLEQLVNLVTIDKKIDLGNPDDELNSENYLSKILVSKPCILFNQSSIGVQAPYSKQSDVDLFEQLYFDALRLGDYNANFKNVEPLLRNGDILSLDMNAVRSSDFISNHNLNPNGFYAHQICQIAKYSGISDKNSSFGIFNVDSAKMNETDEYLLAEIIWYFMDGFSQRVGDFPVGSKKDYLRFIVNIQDLTEDIVFYKSSKSGRWWLEVPYPTKKSGNFERHHLVPCNLEDYELAMKGELPDLWWKTYQKLF